MTETTHIDVVFDGPPDHHAPRFVEVEDAAGRSIKVGEWVDRGDGTWALRLPTAARSRDVAGWEWRLLAAISCVDQDALRDLATDEELAPIRELLAERRRWDCIEGDR